MNKIDIDVSECTFWAEGHCEYYPIIDRYPHCIDYSDCVFRQLKCKEQECEKYKNTLKSIQNYIHQLNGDDVLLEIDDKINEVKNDERTK